jgi:predicted RNA binding protein YcfA (HicA-like mRNA interferase family)
MPRFGPIRRRELIRYLKQLGFEGPYSGGKHQFMVKDDITVRLPNPHQGDIGQEFLRGYYGRQELIVSNGRCFDGVSWPIVESQCHEPYP